MFVRCGASTSDKPVPPHQEQLVVGNTSGIVESIQSSIKSASLQSTKGGLEVHRREAGCVVRGSWRLWLASRYDAAIQWSATTWWVAACAGSAGLGHCHVFS